jgi:imidazolonepropionase-like amidohydrolase
VEDVAVVMDAGRVVFAGPAAERTVRTEDEESFDGFLMPGVVDRHVHIGMSDPRAVLAGGVTAVRDLGWPPDDILFLAEQSEGPAFDGPLIRAVGPIVTCPGGYPSNAGWAPEGTAREIAGPEEAAEAVRGVLAASGLPVVKIALNSDAGPTLSDAELVAICDTAHASDAIVTAHLQGKGQVERALGAGVDEAAHCPWTEELPEAVVTAMAARMRIVSTLDIHSFGQDTPGLRTALSNLSRFVLAGGTVAYGTDLGNGPIPPGIHVTEARHLLRAGLTVDQILTAMTLRPLHAGEPDMMVLLGGDPREDLNALGDVRAVWRDGRRR